MAKFEQMESNEIGRRQFLHRLTIALSGVGAIIVGVPFVIGWLEPTLRANPTAWRTVGKVDDFTIGDTVEVQYLNAAPLPWTGVSAITPYATIVGARAVNDRTATNVAQIVISGTRRSTPRGVLSMPAFGGTYSDIEIAAVTNYVTARFGSEASKLTAKDVAELRSQTSR